MFCVVVDDLSVDVEGDESGDVAGCNRTSVERLHLFGGLKWFYRSIRRSWRRWCDCCFNVLGDAEKTVDLFIRQAFAFQKRNLAVCRIISYFLIL